MTHIISPYIRTERRVTCWKYVILNKFVLFTVVKKRKVINMYINRSRKFDKNKNLKDVFGAYLLHGAYYDGFYDIPVLEKNDEINLPSKLVPYSKLNTIEYDNYLYCHFYQDDYVFDGLYGIWNSLLYNQQYKKGFNLEKFNKVYAIITPDYSLYCDMPRVLQIYNVYRSRTVGYFLNRLGFRVVANVKWTDEISYEYCFSGITYGSIVAVSTLGCLRANADKKIFIAGFIELIKRIRPKCIILYGTLNDELKKILESNEQNYIFFPSQISKAMGNHNGDEI